MFPRIPKIGTVPKVCLERFFFFGSCSSLVVITAHNIGLNSYMRVSCDTDVTVYSRNSLNHQCSYRLIAVLLHQTWTRANFTDE